jgi:hypothetical protein
MKKFSLLLLLSFFALNAFSQKGYIITKNGDTIKCIVQKELIGKGAKYKLSKNGDFKKVDPDSIREYQLTSNGSIYLLQYLHGTNNYVKWLEKGKINMFEEHYTITTVATQYGNNAIGTTAYYVCKGDLILQPLPADDVECRKMIMDMLGDNFNLAVAFRASNDVSVDNIEDYVKQYNKATAAGGK